MQSSPLSLPSAPDVGSILAPRRLPFGDPSSESREREADADKRPAARILIVEDDWFAGTDMEAALQDAGYDVPELVTSADEAVAAAGDCEPDLVIMDVRLVGERDGVDAALEIARRFGIRSLFVSAYVDSALRTRAEPARPVGWLTKPISGEQLVAAVRNALRRDMT